MNLSRRGFLGRIAAVVAAVPVVAISSTPDAVEAAPVLPTVEIPNPHQDDLARITLLSQLHKDGLITFGDWCKQMGMEDQWPQITKYQHIHALAHPYNEVAHAQNVRRADERIQKELHP